jgi:hypothetical protein
VLSSEAGRDLQTFVQKRGERRRNIGWYIWAAHLPIIRSVPDIALSHFYLFGNLKEKLQSVAVTDREGTFSVITRKFSVTRPDALTAISHNWMKWFRWAVKNGGRNDEN